MKSFRLSETNWRMFYVCLRHVPAYLFITMVVFSPVSLIFEYANRLFFSPEVTPQLQKMAWVFLTEVGKGRYFPV